MVPRTTPTWVRHSELDRTRWPELRDLVLSFEHEDGALDPRAYPGCPSWPLPRVRPRPLVSLERVLAQRRSRAMLGEQVPPRAVLGRMLQFAHGISAEGGRGPVPSAGGLQALELYMVNLSAGWVPAGLYHFSRADHCLAQLATPAARERWRQLAPSMDLVQGGALLWVIVGDGARVERKYGDRGHRFLVLEAGHLMQNLCLVSASVRLTTVPLGGYFEGEIARELRLLASDVVLYIGLCG